MRASKTRIDNARPLEYRSTTTFFPISCAGMYTYPRMYHYLSIYGIYIALLQANYSEAFPAQARAKIKVLRSLKNELDKSRVRERISGGRLFQREGPTIAKALCCLMAVRAVCETNSLSAPSHGKVYMLQ